MVNKMEHTAPSDVAVRLLRSYDRLLLQRDLEAVGRYQPAPQPGEYHNGEWVGVSLIAQGGQWNWAGSLLPSLETIRETEILCHTPYFKKILEEFECPKLSVRILSLPPGGKIGKHCDAGVGFHTGLLRLHIPIITHEDVQFFIGGQRMYWLPGELWYGDFSRVHFVENESPITRYHMVLDVGINDNLLKLFPEEFLLRRGRHNIKPFRQPLSLGLKELESFACSFSIPAEVMHMIAQNARVEEAARTRTHVSHAATQPPPARPGIGSARIIDGRLVLLVESRLICALEPIGDNHFQPMGMSQVALQFEKSDGLVRAVKLLFADQPIASFPVMS